MNYTARNDPRWRNELCHGANQVDLLTFSRIGQSEVQKTEVNLDQLIQETLGDFQGETKEENIAWKILLCFFYQP